MLQHVVDPLPCQDLIRVGGLAQAVEEQRQEVVVVQLVDLHLRTSSNSRRYGRTAAGRKKGENFFFFQTAQSQGEANNANAEFPKSTVLFWFFFFF